MSNMNQNYVGLISACTALIATIVGPYVTIKSARLQAYASVLPSNRSKWIDGVRDLVSTAVAQLTTYLILRATVPDHDRLTIARDPGLLIRFEQNTLTISKLRLMLNPSEFDTRQLVETLDAALTALRSQDPQHQVEIQVKATIERAMQLCQGILKQEWLRVKQGT